MAVTFADYLQYMQDVGQGVSYTDLQPLAKFELLNPDETIYASFSAEVTGGTLNVNRANGVRRSCDISVQNIQDEFTPNPLTYWIGQKIKLSLGYEINGEDYYIPQGVFGVSNPQLTHVKSQKEGSISGVDKFAFLNGQLGGRLAATYSFVVGSNIVDSMKAVLLESAVNDPVLPFLMIDSAEVTPYTIYQEYGKTFADVQLELNSILSYNMYYSMGGRFTCEPDILNSLKPSQWDFRADSKIYLGIVENYNWDEAYNIVMVVGDNVNGNLALGIARNDDPSSPISTFRIGEKLAPPIQDAVIDTDARAQDRANFEITRYASLARDVVITSIPLFHLDVDQIISVYDEDVDLHGDRFLINSLSIPLNPSNSGQTMTINATSENDLDFVISNS
jgi:hypothetical protein